MGASLREQYLQVLGIDVWVPRPGAFASVVTAPAGVQAPVTEQTPVAEQVPAEERMFVKEQAVGAREGRPSAMTVVAGRARETSGDVQAAWDQLRAEVSACVKCGLHSTRTQTVFGVGNTRAEWLVVGEAPGAEEDRKGEPFVGRAGQLLDAMLHAIGLSRDSNVYVANILKCRPPNNRDPRPDEVACCMPYLVRQIALLQPRLILAVGRIAAQNLLGTTAPLGRLRGQVHSFGELNTPLIVTYHPAYLLRTPADKRKAWEDLKFARAVFRQLASQAQ